MSNVYSSQRDFESGPWEEEGPADSSHGVRSAWAKHNARNNLVPQAPLQFVLRNKESQNPTLVGKKFVMKQISSRREKASQKEADIEAMCSVGEQHRTGHTTTLCSGKLRSS